MISEFEAPIPGQSLTTTPKNAPYENPPELVQVEDVIDVHLNNLSKPKVMESVLELLESGQITIVNIVRTILRIAISNGVHTIDTGLFAAPVMHEFIKQTANVVGIDYEEGFEDKKKNKKIEEGRIALKAKEELKKSGYELPEIDIKDIDEVEPEEVEEVTQKIGRGLMSRGEE